MTENNDPNTLIGISPPHQTGQSIVIVPEAGNFEVAPLDAKFGEDLGNFRLPDLDCSPLSPDEGLRHAHERYQAAKRAHFAAKVELACAQKDLLIEVLKWRGDGDFKDFKRGAASIMHCSEVTAEQYLRAARGAEKIGYLDEPDEKTGKRTGAAALSSLAEYYKLSESTFPAHIKAAGYLEKSFRDGEALPSAANIKKMTTPPDHGEITYFLSRLEDFGMLGIHLIAEILIVAVQDRNLFSTKESALRREKTYIDHHSIIALNAMTALLTSGGHAKIRLPGTLDIFCCRNEALARRCSAALGIEMPEAPVMTSTVCEFFNDDAPQGRPFSTQDLEEQFGEIPDLGDAHLHPLDIDMQ